MQINKKTLFNEGDNSTIRLTNLWPSNSRSNWNLEMLVFEERGKPEYLEKNQGREPTTNSTHILYTRISHACVRLPPQHRSLGAI